MPARTMSENLASRDEARSWDSQWVSRALMRIPHRLRRAMVKNWETRWSEDRRKANLAIVAVTELADVGYRLDMDDDEIGAYAERRSTQVRRILLRGEEERARQVMEAEGIAWPKGDRRASQQRAGCPLWWRRQVRARQMRTVERIAVQAGVVQKAQQIYASDEAVEARRQQHRKNRAILGELEAVSDDGQRMDLVDVVEGSTSNPVIRRLELMTRISGFEDCARRAGHVAMFYTITCPSRMHPSSDRYDGTTPREAQDYLCRQWARARAALHRRGVRSYGLRVAEPHHDGCPHWHLLLFVAGEHAGILTETLHRYALAEDGDEPGARQHRFRVEEIDYERGTAAGYVAKYVSKHLDGAGVVRDLEGVEVAEAAERVGAWASAWRIRQFQQIGGPPVSVWRELRRLKDGAPAGVIGRAWGAADLGLWATFCEVMGGPDAPRKAHPIRLLCRERVDTETGEVVVNRYGESVRRVVGVEAAGVVVVTRERRWVIERRADAGRPWSPVNNCTGAGEHATDSVGVEGLEDRRRSRGGGPVVGMRGHPLEHHHQREANRWQMRR